MKNPILIILALLAGLLPAQAQFQSVTTTANGTLHSPTNLWAQNSLAIANALAANPGVPVVRRASEGDFIGEGVWLAANVSELTMSPADYSGTLINAGPGVLELYNDQPNLVATVRPGETISYTFDDDDNDITITSRWSPAPLPTTNGLLARTGDGTTAARTITAGDSNIIWTNGSGLSGNPTSTINATQTGNRTYANNLTVQGNTTLGDASGDTVTITAATINAANANATATNSISNVGALGRVFFPHTTIFSNLNTGIAPTFHATGTGAEANSTQGRRLIINGADTTQQAWALLDSRTFIFDYSRSWRIIFSVNAGYAASTVPNLIFRNGNSLSATSASAMSGLAVGFTATGNGTITLNAHNGTSQTDSIGFSSPTRYSVSGQNLTYRLDFITGSSLSLWVYVNGVEHYVGQLTTGLPSSGVGQDGVSAQLVHTGTGSNVWYMWMQGLFYQNLP
jgi:hypothetical protein